MNCELQFDQNRRFTLKHAILIYEGKDGTSAATNHPVSFLNSRPVIEAGSPVTLAGVQAMTQTLGCELGTHFIPENVLSLGFGAMAWWTPASRHRIWFRAGGDEAETQLKAVNGKFVYHPPLLFIAANHGLRVLALPRNERPKPDTKLLRAPYYNLSEAGTLCVGSAKIPDVPTPGNCAEYETGFFNSAFTHSNVHGAKLTRHRGGHAGLWTELATHKTPPADAWWQANLVSTQSTVASAIKNRREY